MKQIEKFGFLILVILMTVLSGTSVIAARQARDAARNTDLIAQCTTPGTVCAKLQAEQELRRAAQIMCPVLIELPPPSERNEKRDEIIHNYQVCVNEIFEKLKASPLPGVVATPTTTKEDKD